jgi:atypical dual specificity phosphatase
MDWITENIALGNFIDAKNVSKNDVDAILCLKPDCCNDADGRFDILCLPLVDGAGNNRRVFNRAVFFIDEAVSAGKKILVHCHAGRSRSVCILARYFMMKKGMTKNMAIETIARKRAICLSQGIEEILEI